MHGARDEAGTMGKDPGTGGKASRGAALLKAGLRGADEVSIRDAALKARSAPEFMPLTMVVDAISGAIKPKGEAGCDYNPLDRAINVVTSLPYCAVGLHQMRKRETKAGVFFGACMVATGVAAGAYHATWHPTWRPFFRKVDYWTIAVTATALTRATYQNVPPWVTGLSYCLVPFEPFKLSLLNSLAGEWAFWRRAHRRKNMRPAWRMHTLSSVAGLGFFGLEELLPNVPYIHAGWHVLAAVAAATAGSLLEDVEADYMEVRDKRKSVEALFRERRGGRDTPAAPAGFGSSATLEGPQAPLC